MKLRKKTENKKYKKIKILKEISIFLKNMRESNKVTIKELSEKTKYPEEVFVNFENAIISDDVIEYIVVKHFVQVYSKVTYHN